MLFHNKMYWNKFTQKLKLLLNASGRLARVKGLNNILFALMDVTKTLLDADRCSIFLLDRDTKELWTIVADGVSEIRIPQSAGIAGEVCVSGNFLNIPDAYKDPRFDSEIDKISSSKKVVLYCRTGVRSSKAVKKLQELGFQNVHNLQGGILEWADKIDPALPKY